MNRLSNLAVALAVALGTLLITVPPPALADPIGGVIVIPGTGTNLDPIRLRTSAGCPSQADAYYATMHGHGFPPDGQIVTSNTEAGLSHRIGFDVYVALAMQDYANANRTTLTGRYDITVYCINHVTQEDYGEFTGSVEFTTPTTYQARGAAMPVGPPPPLAEPGSIGSVDSALTPIGSAPSLAPRADSTGSPVDPLASQHNGGSGQGIPWPFLLLAGAAFGVLVAVVMLKQIARRRSSRLSGGGQWAGRVALKIESARFSGR
jgi:hypothetical protein